MTWLALILIAVGTLCMAWVVRKVWRGMVPPASPQHPVDRAQAGTRAAAEHYAATTPQYRRMRVARRRTVEEGDQKNNETR